MDDEKNGCVVKIGAKGGSERGWVKDRLDLFCFWPFVFSSFNSERFCLVMPGKRRQGIKLLL